MSSFFRSSGFFRSKDVIWSSLKTQQTRTRTGCLKKTSLYDLLYVSRTKKLYLLEIQIHASILNTKLFICNFRGLRYLQRMMDFHQKSISLIRCILHLFYHDVGRSCEFSDTGNSGQFREHVRMSWTKVERDLLV